MPFARWQDAAGQVHVIGPDGRILGPDREGRFSALPLFAGEGAPAEAASFEEAIADCEALKGRIQGLPKRDELVQIQLNEQLIVELYSK